MRAQRLIGYGYYHNRLLQLPRIQNQSSSKRRYNGQRTQDLHRWVRVHSFH